MRIGKITENNTFVKNIESIRNYTNILEVKKDKLLKNYTKFDNKNLNKKLMKGWFYL